MTTETLSEEKIRELFSLLLKKYAALTDGEISELLEAEKPLREVISDIWCSFPRGLSGRSLVPEAQEGTRGTLEWRASCSLRARCRAEESCNRGRRQ